MIVQLNKIWRVGVCACDRTPLMARPALCKSSSKTCEIFKVNLTILERCANKGLKHFIFG